MERREDTEEDFLDVMFVDEGHMFFMPEDLAARDLEIFGESKEGAKK